jgi:hypothetical protein
MSLICSSLQATRRLTWGSGFDLNENGGYNVYFDIPAAESGCQHIIYTGSSVNNCGIPAGTFSQPTCAR